MKVQSQWPMVDELNPAEIVRPDGFEVSPELTRDR
jgi:hypothetical protein